jgi:hypothetical protein
MGSGARAVRAVRANSDLLILFSWRHISAIRRTSASGLHRSPHNARHRRNQYQLRLFHVYQPLMEIVRNVRDVEMNVVWVASKQFVELLRYHKSTLVCLTPVPYLPTHPASATGSHPAISNLLLSSRPGTILDHRCTGEWFLLITLGNIKHLSLAKWITWLYSISSLSQIPRNVDYSSS